MTFEELIDEIKETTFPDREAANLVTVHDKYIIDGLIEVQKRVPQLRDRNFNLYDFDETFFRCRATVFDKPDGPVVRLYTWTQPDHCDAVHYQPTTREHIESLLRRSQACGYSADPEDDSVMVGLPPEDYFNASPETDKGWRAATGHYGIIGDQVYVWPHIESYEHITVEWQGIKTQYDPDDLVAFQRDVVAVIELWVKSQEALREDCDTKKYVAFQQAWQTAMAQLVWWYRTKYLLPEPDWRGTGCDSCDLPGITVGGGGGPCPPCPEPPPVKFYTIYGGNGGSDVPAPPAYTAEEIVALDNGQFPNTTVRTMLAGFYQIGVPTSGLNEWKVIAFPAELASGGVLFTSSGFPLPMNELPQVTINEVVHRVFQTTAPNSGDMTFARLNAIAAQPMPE